MSTSLTSTDDNSKDDNEPYRMTLQHTDTGSNATQTGHHTILENSATVISRSEKEKIIDLTANDDDDAVVSQCDPMMETENVTMKLDTKRVIHLKFLVIFILFISASIISIAVYKYIRKSEISQFHSKYYNDANKVFTAIGSSFERTLGTMNAIAVSYVSYADDQDMEWPYMTLPNFAILASKLLPLTEGVYVAGVPMVQPSQRQQWEEYVYYHDEWVNESLAVQEVWEGYHGDITYNWIRNHSIYGAFGDIETNVRCVCVCPYIVNIYSRIVFLPKTL